MYEPSWQLKTDVKSGVDHIVVSTVLPNPQLLPYSHGYETCLFRETYPYTSRVVEHYSTQEQAEIGHKYWVDKLTQMSVKERTDYFVDDND